MEVRNFERRVLEKDSIISSIMAQEFSVPVRGFVQHERKDFLKGEGKEIIERV
jgi:hypothetical protein